MAISVIFRAVVVFRLASCIFVAHKMTNHDEGQ